MINIPFFKGSPGGSLGIDIGTHSIKVVEISGGIDNLTLENYGEIFMRDFTGKSPIKGASGSFLYSNEEIAEALKQILEEADIKSRRAYFSMPDFVSFFTSFDLPPMKEEEVGSAVEFHSRQYIPLPISEVALDWFIDKKEEGKDMKVNLVAVPNEIIAQYQEIAQLAEVDIVSLESEMFSLVRAYSRNAGEVVAVADIGEQSTLLSIGKEGKLKTTHSLEVAGNMLIEQLSKSSDIDYDDARRLIMAYGVAEESIKKTVRALAISLFTEISRIVSSYEKKENKKIDEIVMAGGFSLLPGVLGFAKEQMDKRVVTRNCFEGMSYPEALSEEVLYLSSSHVIALGAALNAIQEK